MNDYLFEYEYEGGTYSMTVRAETPEDARRRLYFASTWGEYKGKIAAVVPVPAGGLLLRVWNWLTNK